MFSKKLTKVLLWYFSLGNTIEHHVAHPDATRSLFMGHSTDLAHCGPGSGSGNGFFKNFVQLFRTNLCNSIKFTIGTTLESRFWIPFSTSSLGKMKRILTPSCFSNQTNPWAVMGRLPSLVHTLPCCLVHIAVPLCKLPCHSIWFFGLIAINTM